MIDINTKYIEDTTIKFIEKYFKNRVSYDRDQWLGGKIGSVIEIDKYYLTFDDIELAMSIDKDNRFLYYYIYRLNETMKDNRNILDFQQWL